MVNQDPDWALTPPDDWTPPPLPELPPLTSTNDLPAPEVFELPELPELPTPKGVLDLAAIEDVKLDGRYWFAPYVAYSITGDALTLHFNDRRVPEQWCNVTASIEQLAEMMAALMKARGSYEPIAFELLKSMAVKIKH